LCVDYENEFIAKKTKTNQRSIFSFRFHRIVLDEAHIIRNPKASMSKACLKIDAEFRFGLTGTPIINKAEDACTLFQFLGVEPISSTEIFRRSISQPVREGNPAGLALLRTIFSHFALRRTKEKEGITLPLKTVEIIPIKFPEDSVYSKIYSSLFLSAKTAFVAILTAGDEEALKEYMSILELILRLRQAW
jgi:SNF2 family DNA or RNA helicase